MLLTITLKIIDTQNNQRGEILIARNASLSQLQTAITSNFRIRNFVVMHKNRAILLNAAGTLDQLNMNDNDELSLIPIGESITEEVKAPENASIIVKNDDQDPQTILVELDSSFQELVNQLQSKFGNGITNDTVMLHETTVLTLKAYRNFSLRKMNFKNGSHLNVLLRVHGG